MSSKRDTNICECVPDFSTRKGRIGVQLIFLRRSGFYSDFMGCFIQGSGQKIRGVDFFSM